MSRKKKYFTEEEKKEAHKEAVKRYYQNNKKKCIERMSNWQKKNTNYSSNYYIKYYSTKKGRATMLLQRYRGTDKEHNRGECTLTSEWIVENIFSQHCHYCGESDWTKIGCDRVDSSKPHTPDNVVPCCEKCNKKKHTTSYNKYMSKISYNIN